MKKNYRVSNKPILAETGQFILTRAKTTRKPIKNWKTVYKLHVKHRTVKVQERALPLSTE